MEKTEYLFSNEHAISFLTWLIETTEAHWKGDNDATFGCCDDRASIAYGSWDTIPFKILRKAQTVIINESIQFNNYRIALPSPEKGSLFFLSIMWKPGSDSMRLAVDAYKYSNKEIGSDIHYWFSFRIEKPAKDQKSVHDFYHGQISFEQLICLEDGSPCKKNLPGMPTLPLPANNFWECVLILLVSLYNKKIVGKVMDVLIKDIGIDKTMMPHINEFNLMA
jgi:hypothetical protein